STLTTSTIATRGPSTSRSSGSSSTGTSSTRTSADVTTRGGRPRRRQAAPRQGPRPDRRFARSQPCAAGVAAERTLLVERRRCGRDGLLAEELPDVLGDARGRAERHQRERARELAA